MAILRKQNPNRIRVLWNLSCTEIEYIKGKPSGTYVIETQGALINGISYKNNKGSTLEFEPNYDMDYEIINNKLKKNNIFCE